jgi:hypothetical protein
MWFYIKIYNQQSIKFLFFKITTTFTLYHYTITQIKLINYYWPLCQCLNLISFRIYDLVLFAVLVRSFSMKINYCWINIFVSSNHESFKYWPMKLLLVQWFYLEEFEETKGAIRIRLSKTDITMTKGKSTKGKNNILRNIYIKLKVE